MKAAFLSVILSGLLSSAAPVDQPLPADSSVYLMTAMNELNTPSQVEKREVYGPTAAEGFLCRPVTVLFARGTLELGNVGLLAGPPFFNALSSRIGGSILGVQGVPYAATIAGYLEQGDPAGSVTFGQMADDISSKCPNTKLVLSGYSQGAQIVHNGAIMMAQSTAAQVAAVVLFGDPFSGRPFPNISADKVKTFCFATDLICEDTIVVFPSHLSYSLDALPAAAWVASKV